MQDHPGAPGTARQGRTGTSVPTDSGGVATQPRAPSHERPLAAQRAAGHGWLSAALEAPGDDVPLATTARAPGHNCLSAASRAPGHGRPLAAQRAAGRDRLSAALPAPGADVPLATTARAPGQHRLSAAPIATVPSPAGLPRLRQGVLPRVPANPRTHTYPHSHRLNRHSRFPPRRSRESGNPRPPVATGGPQGGYAPATCAAYSHTSLYRSPHTTHQVHPAIQVPPHPRSCSTADTGFLRHHPRAPPRPPAENLALSAYSPPLHHVERGRVAGHSRTTPGSIRAAVPRHRVRPNQCHPLRRETGIACYAPTPCSLCALWQKEPFEQVPGGEERARR